MDRLVSIVIATYNSAATVTKTIEACLNQDYPGKNVEIIVVDDGSTDDTRAKLEHLSITYLYQENSGPATARNHGWKKAKGEIIFFTDSDCIPKPDWLKRHLVLYDNHSVVSVGGSYDIANPESVTADCIHQEIITRHQRMPRQVRALGSYNMSVRRSVLEGLGGFSQRYTMPSGEDNDLSYRMIKAGGILLFEREAQVFHYHPFRILRYLRSQFWHGFWRVYLYFDHPDMAGGDDYSSLIDYVQPWLALLILGLLPFIINPLIAKALILATGLEIILQLPLFFAVIRRKPRLRYCALVLITFFRAFSRGLGMVWGVLTFLLRRAYVFAVLFLGVPMMLSAAQDPGRLNPNNVDDIKKAIGYLENQSLSRPQDPFIKSELAKAYSYYAIALEPRDIDLAVEFMQKACDSDPKNAEYPRNISQLHMRRAYQYYRSQNKEKAVTLLKLAVGEDPNNCDAYKLLAEIAYNEGSPEDAVLNWEHAQSACPSPDTASKIAQVKEELAQKKDYKERETQNFVFLFDRKLDEFHFGNMENILNEVYVKTGQEFNYFPSYRIVVQVYSPQRYRSEIEPAQNVIARFDGKIRLPEYTSGDSTDYRRIVYHEYMHAMVYDLSKNRAPRWLHEGLATYSDPGFSLDQGLLNNLYRTKGLVALSDLDGYFSDVNNMVNLAIAYNEANSLMRYFFSRNNFWHMSNILKDIGSGLDIDSAFRKEVYLGIDDFFRKWQEEEFGAKLKKGA